MTLRSKGKRSFKNSLRDCFNGLDYVIVNEDNFKREIILGATSLILGFILNISRMEFIVILLMIMLVLFAEVINTAIERVVDLYTSQYNEMARIVKDVAASSVIIVCFFAIVVGLVIYVPKILVFLGGK